MPCASRVLRGTGLTGHPWPGSPWLASLPANPYARCDARRCAGGIRVNGNGRSANHAPELLLLPCFCSGFCFRPPLASRASQGLTDRPRRGRGTMPKPFCRARDGASESPGRTEKHRVSVRALRALLAADANARPWMAGPGSAQ